MPFLIEIIGPPGSGKSTISKALTLLLKKNNIKILRSNEAKIDKLNNKNYNLLIKIKLFFITTKHFFYYFLLLHKIYFLKKNFKKNYFLRMLKLNFLHTYNINYLKNYLDKNDIIIMEPGPIMFFLHEYFYSNNFIDDNIIHLFNDAFLDCNLIISLNSNNELLYSRINDRERGIPLRMKEMNKSQIIKILSQSQKTLDKYINFTGKYNSNFMIINTDSIKPVDIANKIYTKFITLNIIKN